MKSSGDRDSGSISPLETPPETLYRALRALNRRRIRERKEGREPSKSVAELLLGRPATRLAVYGSLAPGEVNHGVVREIDGTWTRGWVRGSLHPRGWGRGRGFPGFVWNPGGERVSVQVLDAESLPAHWERIDRFEGVGYLRILVPVHGLEEGPTVCNLYSVDPYFHPREAG